MLLDTVSHPELRLLTIPREIRDRIYSFLHHETHFTRSRRDPRFSEPVSLTVHNSPLLSVLLSHSRLRDEYLEAECFRHARFTIRHNLLPSFESAGDRLEASQFLSRISAFLRTLTVFVEAIPGNLTSSAFWTRMTRLARALVTHAPKLSSIQIAACFSPPVPGLYKLPKIKKDLNATSRGKFILPPPNNLSSLALVQRGEGYRIDSSVGIPVRYIAPARYTERGLLYYVEMFGAHIFAQDVNAKDFWRVSELEEKWPNPAYSDRNIRMLREEGEEIFIEVARITEWKEMREAGLEHWQDGDAEAIF